MTTTHSGNRSVAANWVNGKPWKAFDATRESVILRHVTGLVTVEARYA